MRLIVFAALLVAACASTVPGQAIARPGPDSVRIVRDSWGVPHIFASREEDGYFGFGYAMAQDRLESVLRRYLATTGRLADVFGSDSLGKDIARLQWQHLALAKKALSKASVQLRRDYTAFVRGIERYIHDHPGAAPTWAASLRLDPAMPVAWSRLWAFYWAEGLDECALGGAPVDSALLVGVSAGGRAMPASNAWVVAPRRTASGAAILVGDSHSEFTGNGEMYEFRMHAGTIDVSGTSGVGTAWVIVGHTNRLAWTTTNRPYDGADCYRVVVSHSNPRRFMYDGRWRTMTANKVSIKVHGGAPVARTFEYTNHNGVLSPVVARRGDTAWVVSNPYMDRAGLIDEQLHAQLSAGGVDDLIRLQAEQDLWPTNLMSADALGNVYYLRSGRIPVRRSGFDWTRPLDGNSSSTAWGGIHPLGDLVQVKNPPSGYMQNNNVSPDVMWPGSDLTPNRYTPEVYGERPGNQNFRGRRAIDLLSRDLGATPASMMEILFDEKWEAADAFVEGLRQALARNAAVVAMSDSGWNALADRLAHFDGFAHKESAGALDYLYWRRAIAENVTANQVLVRLTLRDSVPGRQYDAVLLDAISRARILLHEELRAPDRVFGDVFRVGRGAVSLPLGGFVGTMRAMVYGSADAAGHHFVYSGQRQPMVVVMSNPVQSFTSLNFGESNDSTSVHYADQSILMSDKRLKPTWFMPGELPGHIENVLTLRISAPDR